MISQRLLFGLLGLLLWPSLLWAQSNFFQEDVFQFETDVMSGFSDDGRVKVLMLTLSPYGMTETAADEVAKALQLSIFNTNHFTVVGPSEWNAQIRDRDPSLADCNDIACGVLIGKLFRADKVLVGSIRTENVLMGMDEVPGMTLSVRLVDVVTNETNFTDEIQFTDDQMHEQLFLLARRLSDNTELQGFVTGLTSSGIVIDLGTEHGLEMGTQLTVFRRETNDLELQGEGTPATETNIAIARVHRVSEGSADAIIIQRLTPVQEGDLVRTYINFDKQIRLISTARRELDTQKRLTPPTEPLNLQPELVVSEEDLWRRRLARAEAEEERWMLATIGTGAGTLLLLSGNLAIVEQGGIGQILPWAAGGAFLYSGYEYLQARNLVSELSAEGAVKGYSSNWNFEVQWLPDRTEVSLEYRF